MTRSVSRVRTRVATPVVTHVEAIRSLMRASDPQPDADRRAAGRKGRQARQDAVNRGGRDGIRLRGQVV